MAITWGAWQYAGGNGMRVGVDVSVSAVSNSSTNVVFTVVFYTENQYAYSDPQTITFGGNISGSVNYTNSDGGGITTWRATKTPAYTYSTYGTSPGNWTFTGTISGTYNSITPTVSVTVAIPARPYSVPASVTAATVAWVTDTQFNMSWTNNSTASGYYSSIIVQRATDSAGYVTVATLAGTATSWSDTTTSANHKYAWRIGPSNTAGTTYTIIATTPTMLFTSPPAPTGLTATQASVAADVVLTWTDNATYNDGVEVWHAADGVWDGSALATVGDVTTYTHVAPDPGVTHTYKVRATISAMPLAGPYSADSAVIPLGTSAYLGVTGTWVPLPVSVGVAGSWVSAVPYIGVAGSWVV